MIRGVRIDGSPRGLQRALDGFRRGAESVSVLVGEHDRQHRPAIRMRWRLFQRPFESNLGLDMLLSGDALCIPQAAQQRFVWSQLREWLTSNGLAHAVRQ